MQTIFSVDGARIRRIEANDTFSDYSMYKKSFSVRQRSSVQEIARNGALTARSLLWIFADLKNPERSCKESLGELCKAGVLTRLEIWHGSHRSGIAYTISTVFGERFGKEVSILRYLQGKPEPEPIPNTKNAVIRTMAGKAATAAADILRRSNREERELTVEEQLEWLSIASLVAGAQRASYKTDKQFPLARIRNGAQQLSYVAISCRKKQELLPRAVFLTDQMAGRREWRGIVIFESFQAMQQEMTKLIRELGAAKLPIYGTYDRACIESRIVYRVEYTPGAGTTFTPVQLQGKERMRKNRTRK